MLQFLKNHPFPVEAEFDHSIVLTFAIPIQELEKLIPQQLTLDTYQDKYGFIAVAMVQTHALRPKGLPRFMGNNFFLIGYRIFVRYRNQLGKTRRGLYIIKSETDRKKMEILGNIFTHYNYTTTDITEVAKDHIIEIRSLQSQFHIIVDESQEEKVPLPAHSPFPDWNEARKFAGPMPFTFSVLHERKEIVIIEGVREKWKPRPIQVKNYDIDFLNQKNFSTCKLANAFIIRDVSYFWKKGIVEHW